MKGVEFMAIKPVDFQVMIPKMSEVSKINNDAQQKGLILQQQDNIKIREEINNNLKQVYNKEDVQYGIILNTVFYTKKPLSYLTTGQSVPDDIEVVDIDKIAKNLLGGAREQRGKGERDE
jgi:hypothetical protein